MPGLVRMLEAAAEHHGARTAFVWRGERIGFDRVVRAVRARALALAELGVGASQAVGLLLPNCPDFAVNLFAIAARGGIAIPLNPLFKADEVDACLRGTDLAAIITDRAASQVAREVAEGWERPVPVQESDGANTLETDSPAGAPLAVASEGDVLHGFSSGSTGAPKRIVRTQANLVGEADSFTATVELGPEDVILGVVPFFHAHGLGNCVLAAMRSGATLVIEERFDPRSVLAAIESERVSILPGVPFIFRMLAEIDPSRRVDMSSLRLCFSAGAPLPPEIFEAFDKRFAKPVRQLYGCTEAGSVTINLDADAAGTAGSVGLPMRDVEVATVDEGGARCEPGIVGEITIAGPALGRIDSGAQAEDRAAFREERFFTGDLGTRDERGRLTVTGRKKIFISTPASKIDPFEVEGCLGGHPGVREVVVVGVKARRGDELVKAVIVPRDDVSDRERRAALRRELVAHCRRHLAEFKVPRQFEFRREIPRSPLGKVLRKYLT